MVFIKVELPILDAIQSFANIKTVQRILGEAENYITDINVKLYDIEKAFPLAKKIEQQFNLTAIDIKTANAQFETGTTIRNLITYAVSITLLIVAGFGIYNILNMLIYEKMNDIAILKATGFSGKRCATYFYESSHDNWFCWRIIRIAYWFWISEFNRYIFHLNRSITNCKNLSDKFESLVFCYWYYICNDFYIFCRLFTIKKSKKNRSSKNYKRTIR